MPCAHCELYCVYVLKVNICAVKVTNIVVRVTAIVIGYLKSLLHTNKMLPSKKQILIIVFCAILGSDQLIRGSTT